MAVYTLTSDNSKLLDTKFEIKSSTIVLYSRGGTKGKNALNPDYSEVLRTLLRRLLDAKFVIEGAWVDSNRVQNLSLQEREILNANDIECTPDALFRSMTNRMQKVGRAQDSESPGGNPTRRISIKLQNDVSEDVLVNALQATRTQADLRSQERLLVEDLKKITPEHIWNAVQLLSAGSIKSHFGKSTDFDLIADNGTLLAPKAVFGIAASKALGFRVLPKHFSGGESSTCFRLLRSAGYQIVPKSGGSSDESAVAHPLDEQWTEGKSKLVAHVRRERGRGLAKAKKAEFRRLHDGRLFCEKCNLDPIMIYESEHAEACIEVHHHVVQVQNMNDGHTTKLEDLQCLCANCHRLVHRLLKVSALEGDSNG